MSDSKMRTGEVICSVRDAIKKVKFPGSERVARKGSHIIFDVDGETYSCSVQKVKSKKSYDRNSPVHDDDSMSS